MSAAFIGETPSAAVLFEMRLAGVAYKHYEYRNRTMSEIVALQPREGIPDGLNKRVCTWGVGWNPRISESFLGLERFVDGGGNYGMDTLADKVIVNCPHELVLKSARAFFREYAPEVYALVCNLESSRLVARARRTGPRAVVAVNEDNAIIWRDNVGLWQRTSDGYLAIPDARAMSNPRFVGDPRIVGDMCRVRHAAVPIDVGSRPSGWVYLFACNGLYKIGRSKDPEKRMADIASAMPFSIECVHKIPAVDPVRAEYFLHKQFSAKRVKGEWFDLSPDDVRLIKGLATL